MSDRDLALVLSGGGMNGLLLELGFLQRLRGDRLWDRVGWIYGTSAGALSGVMAVLDRLDELEAFVLELRPEETFRPNRLWQLPLAGLHDYALPETIAARLAPIDELAAATADAPIELVVCVTDVTESALDEQHVFERVYSSRATPPAVMAQAILASAAISALVLPLRVDDVIGTDGGWVRNFPLGHAYDNPAVAEIIGFRYVPPVSTSSPENLVRLRRRLEPFRAVPPVGALIGELRVAEERQARGEPPHLADMIVRLMRVTVARNTELEVRSAEGKDASVRELDGATRRRARDRPPRGTPVAPALRRTGGRRSVRSGPVPVPTRPGPAADDRARRAGRARARRRVSCGTRVAARVEAGAHRARARADRRGARVRPTVNCACGGDADAFRRRGSPAREQAEVGQASDLCFLAAGWEGARPIRSLSASSCPARGRARP